MDLHISTFLTNNIEHKRLLMYPWLASLSLAPLSSSLILAMMISNALRVHVSVCFRHRACLVSCQLTTSN